LIEVSGSAIFSGQSFHHSSASCGSLVRASNPESVWLELSGDSVFFQRSKVDGLGFCRKGGADQFKQSAVIA
jgi:hypothetical protein